MSENVSSVKGNIILIHQINTQIIQDVKSSLPLPIQNAYDEPIRKKYLSQWFRWTLFMEARIKILLPPKKKTNGGWNQTGHVRVTRHCGD